MHAGSEGLTVDLGVDPDHHQVHPVPGHHVLRLVPVTGAAHQPHIATPSDEKLDLDILITKHSILTLSSHHHLS